MKTYFIQDGQPVEIKRSSELNIKLSKKEEKQLRKLRAHRKGVITLEFEVQGHTLGTYTFLDPYKDFKDKIKAQIKGNCSEIPNN